MFLTPPPDLLQLISKLSAPAFQAGASLVIGEPSPLYLFISVLQMYRVAAPLSAALLSPLPNSPTRNHIKENAAADTMRGLEMNQSLLFLCSVDSCAHICTRTHAHKRKPYSSLGEVSKKKLYSLRTFFWVHGRITQKCYAL